jgi:hypothetical protein
MVGCSVNTDMNIQMLYEAKNFFDQLNVVRFSVVILHLVVCNKQFTYDRNQHKVVNTSVSQQNDIISI